MTFDHEHKFKLWKWSLTGKNKKKSTMKKTEIKDQNFLTSCIRLNNFDQIISFLTDTIYIFNDLVWSQN